MCRRTVVPAVVFLLSSIPAITAAQNALPATQPTVLTIFREDVKYGHAADHEKTETGWPAALARAKSPYTYIALTSITGSSEAWFMTPYANWNALGESMKFESSDAILAAELARLSKADAEHVTAGRSLHLVGRPDLGAGPFPTIAKQRFYEITWFRVRPGHDQEFEQLAKTFGAAFKKIAPQSSYRVYQVVGGVPGPTYMVFSSVQSLGEMDQGQETDAKVMAAFTQDEQRMLQKFTLEGMINSERQLFAVNGPMSYVDDATIAQDPSFWRPKPKTAMKASGN